MQLGDFLFERQDEQVHQDRDLVGRATPILAREREQRQIFDATLDRAADRAAHRFDALCGGRRHAANGAPAPSARCHP